MGNWPSCAVVYGMYTEKNVIELAAQAFNLDEEIDDVWEEVKNKSNIEIVTNSYLQEYSNNGTYHIIGIPSATYDKYDMYQKLDIHKMAADQIKNETAWDKRIEDFCKKIGLKYKKPCWYATGDYS